MVNKKKNFGDLLKSYLQRPYYWSWGGSVSNSSNRWPKKEDKLRKTNTRGKPIQLLTVNSTDTHAVFDQKPNHREPRLFTEEASGADFNGKSTNNALYMFDDVSSVLPTRATTLDYQIDRKQPKWNFNLSIG